MDHVIILGIKSIFAGFFLNVSSKLCQNSLIKAKIEVFPFLCLMMGIKVCSRNIY